MSDRREETQAIDPDQRAALAAARTLSEWAADLTWETVPDEVRDRLRLVLLDTLGVTMLGARLPERAGLVDAWTPGVGSVPLIGTGVRTSPEVAAWLNATALVSLEMDEGNKFAGGHPAAHGFPAVLALAAAIDADGPSTAAALLVAYEVGARYGRASAAAADLHPHGNWGFTGAAAGCAKLLSLDADQITGAVDAASGMPIAGPFSAALDGNPVRNEWMGACNVSGLAAARLAKAGMAIPTGIAAHSLGRLLGTFSPDVLVERLDKRWDIGLGYFKRHASCAFTHPTADATLELRSQLGEGGVGAITGIRVSTYSAAANLHRTRWNNRLAAMFSIPYVVATALRDGRVAPDGFDASNSAEFQALADRVEVVADAVFDDRLPDARGAAVEVTLADGRVLREEAANPIGDSARQPFDHERTVALLGDLLGDGDTVDRIVDVASSLPEAPGVRALLQTLTHP
ncbi:MmgE/PrpD family protein [Gordonia liuliyuniae]|uniref:MmgE/PrpD family protein n=1 Tax=Gordonia liuliyuniae TaxID=2911517 RepID=A0ABS9IWR7_9ACTN|nr:MmgE/PrpD family protein [Gordonia liuliyuniae]MCF8590009.1 MmgE/PrpD family protein [Gordonia liuliyuniae]